MSLDYFDQSSARDQVTALLDRVRLNPSYRPAIARRPEALLQLAVAILVTAVMAFSAMHSHS